jgi:DNA-binding transcriptional ArsR family regulator
MENNTLTSEHEKMARYARALGHPVRIFIIELLAGQSCCYTGDLSEELPIARSTLSQHIKELKDSGLIQGEYNPPKIRYCLNRQNYEEARMLFRKLFNQK